MFMMAEGAERGLVADLVDSELSCVTTAARTAWPRLLGRAVAMQLSVGRDSVPSGLQGFKLEEVMKLTSTQAGWRELELGHIYRMVKCAFNSAAPPAKLGTAAYTTAKDIDNALMVAEVVMTLRGFPGSGPGTLPHVLAQVAQSWTLYGGDGAPEVAKVKLAE